MLEERSAGAIIFDDRNGHQSFLLLHYPSGHWDFPKGSIEKDERPIDTVKREVKEETGIADIEIIEGFKRRIEYHYRRDHMPVHKEVVWLLARTKTRNIVLSFEHEGYAWLSFKEALTRVTYKNSKNVLLSAIEFLDALKFA